MILKHCGECDYGCLPGCKNCGNKHCITVDDTKIGWVCLEQSELLDTMLHLWNFEIVTEYRRRGYGSAALALIAKWASANNYDSLGLRVVLDNKEAIAFYVKFGFVADSVGHYSQHMVYHLGRHHDARQQPLDNFQRRDAGGGDIGPTARRGRLSEVQAAGHETTSDQDRHER